jgi:beta-lactam-binding protein with PASTA domain
MASYRKAEEGMSPWKVLSYISVAIFVFLVSLYITMAILLKTPENVICPDLRGKPIEEAKAIAERHGLSITILRYERRDNIPYNHITIQRPEPNIAIRRVNHHGILSEGRSLFKSIF